MRVTEQAQFNRTVSTIKRNYTELEASQTRLSTGQRVQYPHQNVTSTINSIYYRASSLFVMRVKSSKRFGFYARS